jgi:hypothetical protein
VNPEVEEVLKSFGWKMPHWPEWFVAHVEAEIRKADRLGAERRNRLLLEGAAARVFEAFRALRDLPKEVQGDVSRAAEALSKLEAGHHEIAQWGEPQWNLVPDTCDHLWRVLGGIDQRLDVSVAEAPQKRGGQKNYAARKVAHALALVFVAGRGAAPSVGRRADGQGASGEYGQAIEKACAALQIDCSDVYRPASDTITSLEASGQVALLQMLADPSSAGGVSFGIAQITPKF